jgi:glycerol-3-phosphate acyltransferase PlsY
MQTILLFLLSYLSGSLPFSVWFGRIFLDEDVRQFGDGNPGATNVFRAGSPLLGLIVLFLDIAKAALPVGLIHFQLGVQGIPLVLIATAPVLGHMYSPFLGFQGGKALAVSLGVWIGLSTWKLSLPAVVGVVLGWMILSPTGWSVMLAMASILAVILIWLPSTHLLLIWAIQTALLAWTHRDDFQQPPSFLARLKHKKPNNGDN